MGKAYAVYFRRVLPAIGRVICGKDGPYNYLPSSVGDFPHAWRDGGDDANCGLCANAPGSHTRSALPGCTPRRGPRSLGTR